MELVFPLPTGHFLPPASLLICRCTWFAQFCELYTRATQLVIHFFWLNMTLGDVPVLFIFTAVSHSMLEVHSTNSSVVLPYF